MTTSVITQPVELAPQAGIEALTLETAGLHYDCGAMVVHLTETSEQHPFYSGAVGITDAEVTITGRLEDPMMVSSGPRLLKGNVLFIPGTELFETQREIERMLRRQPDASAEAELALARMLYGQPVGKVAYGGLIRYWPHKLQYASSHPRNSTLQTFVDTFPAE